MNIFFLDRDPKIAARQYINKHIVKIPTEIVTMVLWPIKTAGYILPKTKRGDTIKLSHKNHPVSLWVRESSENLFWTVSHLQELVKEYKARYKREHFAQTYLNYLYELDEITQDMFFEGGDFPMSDIRREIKIREIHGWANLTPLPRCFGEYVPQLAHISDTVEAYRTYYKIAKKQFAEWPEKSKIPKWWGLEDKSYVDKSFKNGDYIKR